MTTEIAAVRPRLGFICAIGAQLVWGGFPLYYSFLKSINVFDLVAHRAVWSTLVVALVLIGIRLSPSANQKPVREFFAAFKDGKTLRAVTLAAVLVGTNWLAFVWAITHERALDASLGYYICPQVNVLLGVLVLRERLIPLQWIAVVLAAIGVIYISSFSDGIPWFALIMASSFGMYGLIKKQISVSAFPGLAFETGILIVPAIALFGYRALVQGESLVASPLGLNGLLVLSGVLTVSPLALYATALRHIPLSTAGLLQFIGPSLQFFTGVYLLGEPFDESRLIGFIFVWIGLALFLISSRTTNRGPVTN